MALPDEARNFTSVKAIIDGMQLLVDSQAKIDSMTRSEIGKMND